MLPQLWLLNPKWLAGLDDPHDPPNACFVSVRQDRFDGFDLTFLAQIYSHIYTFPVVRRCNSIAGIHVECLSLFISFEPEAQTSMEQHGPGIHGFHALFVKPILSCNFCGICLLICIAISFQLMNMVVFRCISAAWM